ncbi:hypothetical protein [Verrucosispora sp. WMMD1129]|uniref:hypothetical protein n=1 Tax=Verrucosispora sp. WMMD1129 TaxID=3016093 RepID=UPI00249BDB91|nr:hypothetical protein [Verrucosispora sp. WMMD1129]WFE47657.1 hypothetical protein O7624_26690 [Verrucosispora sp. WMMD1129]
MRGTQFKSTAGHSRSRLVVPVVAVAAVTFAVGRLSAPAPAVQPAPPGVRVVGGVPVGFAGTARGGGDAAAAFVVGLSVAATRSAAERQTVIAEVMAEGVPTAEVVGEAPTPANGATIVQTVVARVWVPNEDLDARLPQGAEVEAQLLVCALSGAAIGGGGVDPEGGLAGGWYVQAVRVRWAEGRWRIVAARRPLPVPPPDLRGTQRDGGPRDMRPLADVLSARSWVPGTV